MGSSQPDPSWVPNTASSDHDSVVTPGTENPLDPLSHESPDEGGDAVGLLPRDKQQKTATYDYAYEKSLSHAEAKLFYQHHQQTSKGTENPTSTSPVMVARSMPDAQGDGSLPTDSTSQYSAQAGRKGSMILEPEIPASTSPLQPGHGFAQGGYGATNEERSDQASPYNGVLGQRPSQVLAGLDTVGLGIVSHGPGGDAVTAELGAIYRKIQDLLDRRHKYMALSLQRPADNPQDHPGWQIYPPPPEPAWDDGKEYQRDRVGGQADIEGKKRKMGEDIGEDFDMDELAPLPGESSWTYRLDSNSVYQVYESDAAAEAGTPLVVIPSLRDFYMDLDAVVDVSTDGPAKSFAFKRLSYLEGKFQLYTLLNEYQEIADSKKVPHRDFYNVRKVDTHVHHSACMNQKHLLRFIKSKMRKSPDEVVLYRDGKHLTLREVFESINLTAYDLSIDTLDMHVSFTA